MGTRFPRVLAPALLALAFGLSLWSSSPAYAAVTRYEQTDSGSVAFTIGSWSTSSHASYSGGSATYSNGVNATVRFSFTVPAGQVGTVTFIGYRQSVNGTFAWSVDGGSETAGSQNAASATAQTADFTTGTITAGSHYVDVRNTGGGIGSYLFVDAFDLDLTPAPTTTTVATTTTTAPPTTTTTTAPPTTTTAPPTTSSPGSACGTGDQPCSIVVEETGSTVNAAGLTGVTFGALTGWAIFAARR